MKVKVILGLGLLLIIASCKKERDNSDKCPYDNHREISFTTLNLTDPMIPISENNYWVYKTLDWNPDGTKTLHYDTVKVESLEWNNGEHWVRFNTILPYMYQSKDSVYVLARMGLPGPKQKICAAKCLKYVAVNSDTTIMAECANTDLLKIKYGYSLSSNFTTEAGAFSDVYEFTTGGKKELVKKGIGLIKAQYYYSPGTLYRDIELIDYYIE
jgi:hypothetical protein